MFHRALPEPVAERNAFVKDKTFAAPAALRFRHALQIFQDSALEMIDLGKTARQQPGAGLFAANAAGAEHRDPAVLRRIETAPGKTLECPKSPVAGLQRPT